MTPSDLIDDLRSRINPAYANQRGTESYERKLCVEALDSLIAKNDRLAPDARRYRWLRENISDDMQWYLLGKHGLGAEGLDEAIDAVLPAPTFEEK